MTLTNHLTSTPGYAVTNSDENNTIWTPMNHDVVAISESVGSDKTTWLKGWICAGGTGSHSDLDFLPKAFTVVQDQLH